MHRSDFSVLIIDDNSDEITLLERFLSRNLIPIRSVIVARKGREGLEKIRDERPDFVIVGDACPDMGRSELLKHIAEITSVDTLPTLCLVNDEATAASQSLRANQIGVVKKTMLTPEKLRDAMLALIEQAEIRVERNRAETLFSLLSENSENAIALTDAAGVLVAANKNYLNLFQLDPSSIGKQIETKNYADIFFKSDHAARSKAWCNDENGNRLELDVKRLFVEERGKRGFMLSIYKVIQSELAEQTNEGQSEEGFSTYAETAWLRKLEVAYKDALQTTLVFLRAKAKRFSKEDYATLLQEHNRRMKFILAASECLCGSAEMLKVSTAQYVESIFETFRQSTLMQQSVVMKYEGETLWIELDEAMFIGLILGELITNALQHAFGNRGGVIMVSFFKEKDETIGMVVSDSGVGMPFKIDAKPPDAMGLMIVSSLTKKLKGKMEVKRQLGTTIRILFSQKKSANKLS
jgi:two-component sensor histidine kinase/CheY-like chemotaxis protein